MVVFTCNNCGDSLQKPKVEKHYATACRTVKNLTCVDCLKDFREEEYAAHTKCITEQERYSAKGSVTSVVGKGEAKQQQWAEMIEEVIKNNGNATGAQKVVFQIMSQQAENVPRKKMKFLNFVKNAGGNKIMYSDIESVWELIEKHKNDQDPSSTTETTVAPDSTTDKQTEESKNEETAVNTENGELSKKKKKKKSKSKNVDEVGSADMTHDQENANTSVDVTNGHVDPQINGKVKKSKKRKSADKNENAADHQPQYDSHSNSTNGESKKKKKKSKNGTDEVVESNNVSLSNEQGENEKPIFDEIPKKKKKKHHDAQADEIETKKTKLDDTIVSDATSESNISKEKKKKKKSEASQQNNVEEIVAEVKVNGNDINVTDTLTRITLKILQKKNSLPLSKLQKKVFIEYSKEGYVIESPKVFKQYIKHVKKMDGVEVLDDTVTLKPLNAC